MSRFQLNDEVRSGFSDCTFEVVVVKPWGGRTTEYGLRCPGDAGHEPHRHYGIPERELRPAEPSVHDVDGNPIRAGQLVEHVTTGELKFVRDVAGPGFSDPGIKIDDGGSWDGFSWSASDLWRVVSETFRAPEPDTRTVELRVKVLCKPDDPRGVQGVVEYFEATAEQGNFDTWTVEVVE